MLNVYGIAPSELITSAKFLALFPSFSGRTVGGAIPVDCEVKLVELANAALGSTADWPWTPAHRGYLVVLDQTPFSVLKNHLRTIRHFQDEMGQNRVWPWFDPRYLKLALNTLEGADLSSLFGPVQVYGFAGEPTHNSSNDPEKFIELYQMHGHQLHIKRVLA